MKTKSLLFALAIISAFAGKARAVTRYVDLNSPSPTPPYTSWPTAAANIQDAIDAAVDGDLVLVTNGVYATGGRIVYGTLTNRVVVDKAITLESINGPDFTVIQGYQIPTGTTNFEHNVRCVYMTNGAVLVGFTITGGATHALGSMIAQLAGGGVFCENSNATLTNCVLSYNECLSRFTLSGGGAVYRGTLNNCLLVNNLVSTNALSYSVRGGGAFQSVLTGCLIVSNSASFGGGAADSTLNNCTVVGNKAPFYGSTSFGGGFYNCAATNCLIAGNYSATSGGGTANGSLDRCTLITNVCLGPFGGTGGGSYRSAMNNCLVVSNAASRGGGVYIDGPFISNCTIAGNTATNRGGGLCTVNASDRARNTLIFGNYCTGSFAYSSNFFQISPANLTNCWSADPMYVDFMNGDHRLQPSSPCINAGNNVFAGGVDLDGNSRIAAGTVDIGAYEFQSPSSILSYAWAQQNGLPTDGSADFTDSDSDGMNNHREWRSDTIPTNALSVLKMVNATNSPTGAKVTWQSVSTRSYWLERATNLGIASPFQSVATNIAGVAGIKTFTDTSATNGGPYFYRVGVQ